MERIYSQRLSNIFGSGNLIPDMTKSLAYQQAGMGSKQRMESLFNMGLPLQSDINRVRYEGSDYNTRSPIYSASPHQPWGSWGALSGPTAEDGTPVSTGKFDTSNSSTPSISVRGAPMPRQLSSQERANINEVDAREARRQRIRNAAIPPYARYARPKPAYDLGKSSNSPSMFNNYPLYGPPSL